MFIIDNLENTGEQDKENNNQERLLTFSFKLSFSLHL